jgi:catechol 2,3-dioxygenase-like lactoylglutathione lyase family enzyme
MKREETAIMKNRMVRAAIAVSLSVWTHAPALAQTALPPPGFHHLHLNSVDPDAAISFYVRQFPDSSKTTWGGLPALKAPSNVLILFTKVDAPPVADSLQTAFWHFGWQVTDVRKKFEFYKGHPEVKLSPLYTADGDIVFIHSDALQGTRAQIDKAKAEGTKPAGGGGVMYMAGPDGALIENVGTRPVPNERFNHVHMFQEDPYCAQLWYQKHLNASVAPALVQNPQRSEADCKVARGERTFPELEREGGFQTPASGVLFDDVGLNWQVTRLDHPLAPTRGHLMDHVALSVADLDAWVAKLHSEGIKFLEEPYRLGDTRAVMIEGPSREAIELVEIK